MLTRIVQIACGCALLLFALHAPAQTPLTGQVTVRLTDGLDSAAEAQGQISSALVTQSSNAAIVRQSPAAVVLVKDSGASGFSVLLRAVGMQGRLVLVWGNHPQLAGGFLEKLNNAARPVGSPRDAVSGGRVFLPAGTLVSFTLAPPPPQPAPPPPPAVAQAAPPTSVDTAPAHPPSTMLDLPPAADGYPPMHASHPAAEGCWWIPFVSQRYGVEMPVQACTKAADAAVFGDDANGVTMQTPGSPAEFLFSVQAKPAAEPITVAILRQFIVKLSPAAARLNCKAHLEAQREGNWQEYGVDATGAYAKLPKFVNMQPGDDGPCGEFDDPDSAAFFLYQPSLSQTHFLYVSGQTEDSSVLPYDQTAIQFRTGTEPENDIGVSAAAVPPSSLNALLDRLSVSATEFSKYLPHFQCEEVMHSTRTGHAAPFERFTPPADMHATDEVEVQSTGGRLNEKRTWLTENGQPVAPGTVVVPPYMLNLAFGIPIPAYLSATDRSCLRFTSPRAGRVNFVATTAAGAGQCADIAPQAVGYILYDPRTMAVTHLERTVPMAVTLRANFAPFAAVDYSPFHKEGDTRSYQLPSHIQATNTGRGVTLNFNAQYIHCHEFHTSVILRDAQGNVLPQ